MPRFSEVPITELDERLEAIGETAIVDGAVREVGKSSGSPEKPSDPTLRTKAASLIESIGTEFSRLRRDGRANAWADLEDQVARSGHILTDSGMMSVKDWVGMMIDIEQFRKAEGGNSEVPGDALARWLSEDDKKTKKSKAVQ